MTRRDPEDYPRVFNRAPAQRADGLVGHGGRELRTRLRNRTPSRASCRVDAASPYRASGLVLWPVSDIRLPLFGTTNSFEDVANAQAYAAAVEQDRVDGT